MNNEEKSSKLEEMIFVAGGAVAGAGLTALAIYNPEVAVGVGAVGGVGAIVGGAVGAVGGVGAIVGGAVGGVGAIVGGAVVGDAVVGGVGAVGGAVGGAVVGGAVVGGVAGSVGEYIPKRQNIYRGLATAVIGASSVLVGDCVSGINHEARSVSYRETPQGNVITFEPRRGSERVFIDDGKGYVSLDKYLDSISKNVVESIKPSTQPSD